jgi:hypothetical protein
MRLTIAIQVADALETGHREDIRSDIDHRTTTMVLNVMPQALAERMTR